VRPLRYDVTLTLDPAAPTFSGRIEIELELAEPTAVVWLHAVELDIDEASLGGAPARVLDGDDRTVGFVPAAPLPAGRARLRVAYRGRAHDGELTGVFRVREGDRWYLFSKFESVFARRAFPCFDEPGIKVPWRLTVRAPRELLAFGNSPATATVEEDGGLRATTFAETPPLPTYLYAFAVGPFDLVDAGAHGRKRTPVRIVVPSGAAPKAAHAREIAGPIFERAEDWFGIAYPFEKLDLLVAPRYPGAMENAALILFGARTLLAEPGQMAGSWKISCAKVLAHEIAHMWFGDLVTMAWWDDLWLNEAFATWMEGKLLGEWQPDWRLDVRLVDDRAQAAAADVRVAARRIRQPIAGEGDIIGAFDAITYDKGAAVLGMFERALGAEVFRRGVRGYLERHALGSARTADFLTALGEAAGRDVAAEVSSFLDQPGIPLVEAELACDAGGARLELAQRRYLPAGAPPAGAAATWSIPICARYPRGRGTARACGVLSAERGVLPLAEARGCPAWVAPNDGAAGYFLTGWRGDLLERTLRALAPAERAALAHELGALATGGALAPSLALPALAVLGRDPEPLVVAAAVSAVAAVGDVLVDDELDRAWGRWVARSFGAAAQRVGVRPRRGEAASVKELRGRLVSLVADDGRDRALAAEASAIGARWLDDRAAGDPDSRFAFLVLAARRGDAAFLDRLLAALESTGDAIERTHLLRASVQFADPALLRRALETVTAPGVDPRDTLAALSGLMERRDAARARVVLDTLEPRLPELAARFPPNWARTLPRLARGLCDPDGRARAAAVFEGLAGRILGGDRELAATLEGIDVCIAARAAQRADLARALR
jgi:alanyl aminopeptidase